MKLDLGRQHGKSVLPQWLETHRETLKRLAALERKRLREVQRRKHPFEEAHDDPAPAPRCWDCLLPREHKIHQVRR